MSVNLTLCLSAVDVSDWSNFSDLSIGVEMLLCFRSTHSSLYLISVFIVL